MASASLWGCELKCSNTIRNTGTTKCQPPCEAVSWNTVLHLEWKWLTGQPPCEAVSWNASKLPWQLAPFVSLLVRLWVEMLSRRQMNGSRPSASLWGCELKYHPYEFFVSFRIVSLLVRLWVEMHIYQRHMHGFRCQPPCEAVSWNASSPRGELSCGLSASLWGCELK